MLPRGRMQALFLVDTGDLAQPLPDACIVVLGELDHEFRLHVAKQIIRSRVFFFEDEQERTSSPTTYSQTTFSQKACKRALHLVKVACPHQPLKHQEIPRGNAPLHEPQCRIEESPNASSRASQQPDLAPGFRPNQQTHESLGFVRPTPADFDSQDDKPRRWHEGPPIRGNGSPSLSGQRQERPHLRQELVFLRSHRHGGC